MKTPSKLNIAIVFIALSSVFYVLYLITTNYQVKAMQQISPIEISLHSGGNIMKLQLLQGDWQKFLHADYHLYVHKAFIEFRNVWGGDTIYVVVTALLRGTVIRNYPISCKYLSNGELITQPAKFSKLRNSWRYEFTGWQTIFILCPIPRNPPYPTRIQLINKLRDESASLLVEFQGSENYELTTCVPITYGDFNSEALIEWFEFQKYFGVEKVSMNIWKVSEENWKVFDYYRSTGLLDVHRLDAPYNISYKFATHKTFAPGKPYFLEVLYTVDLFECMMRNYQRTKFILVQDIDEILVPHTYKNYKDIIHRNSEYNNIYFDMINFDITCDFVLRNESQFHFRRPFRLTLKPNQKPGPPKSIHRSEACGIFLQHNCVKYVQGKTVKRKHILRDDVMLRHYRKHGRCVDRNLSHYTIDTRLNRFAKDLNGIMKFAKHKILNVTL